MIERVGVVGYGLMGAGIAEVSAWAGLDMVVHEVDRERMESGRDRLESSLGRAVKVAKLTPDEQGTLPRATAAHHRSR